MPFGAIVDILNSRRRMVWDDNGEKYFQAQKQNFVAWCHFLYEKRKKKRRFSFNNNISFKLFSEMSSV